mgnify:CR=1 FL=1
MTKKEIYEHLGTYWHSDPRKYGDKFDEKLEQNEDLAKLRAGVSLAKSGVQQAEVMIDD